MNEIKEEIKNKIKEADEKPDLHLVELGNIKYISTKRGVEFIKRFQDMFDIMDRWETQRQKYSKANLQNAENSIQISPDLSEETQPIEAIENLSFIDGVLLTWNIFNKILNKRLIDENGEWEKDENGYDYLGIINDDITSLLWDKVLEHGYLKSRGEHLSNQFCINIG